MMVGRFDPRIAFKVSVRTKEELSSGVKEVEETEWWTAGAVLMEELIDEFSRRKGWRKGKRPLFWGRKQGAGSLVEVQNSRVLLDLFNDAIDTRTVQLYCAFVDDAPAAPPADAAVFHTTASPPANAATEVATTAATVEDITAPPPASTPAATAASISPESSHKSAAAGGGCNRFAVPVGRALTTWMCSLGIGRAGGSGTSSANGMGASTPPSAMGKGASTPPPAVGEAASTTPQAIGREGAAATPATPGEAAATPIVIGSSDEYDWEDNSDTSSNWSTDLELQPATRSAPPRLMKPHTTIEISSSDSSQQNSEPWTARQFPVKEDPGLSPRSASPAAFGSHNSPASPAPNLRSDRGLDWSQFSIDPDSYPVEEDATEAANEEAVYEALGLHDKEEGRKEKRTRPEARAARRPAPATPVVPKELEEDMMDAAIDVDDDIPGEEEFVGWNRECPNMDVGTYYPNINEFRLAVRQYAIMSRFELWTRKSDTTRYRVRCMATGCPWKLCGKTQSDKTVMVHPTIHLVSYYIFAYMCIDKY